MSWGGGSWGAGSWGGGGGGSGTSVAFPGRGSKLYYSLDGITYTSIAQLKTFEPSGSKQTLIDQTNMSSPGGFVQRLPVLVDAGEWDFSGVYSGDATQLLLAQLHGSMAVVWFQAILTDGTSYTFQACVSEYKPFSVAYNKFIPFSGKLTVIGGIQGPLCAFQINAFDPAAFQVELF